MQFLTSLFSGSESTLLTIAAAIGVVFLLILAGLWSMKTFSQASRTFVRGRNRRLTVIDQVAIDRRRQLIIVRRDNIEHLILVGGPQDLVVESGIAAERPAAVVPHRASAATDRAATRPAPSPPPDPLETRAAEDPSARPGAAMERLREMARPAPRRPDSLRHTGLLRPVSRMEAAVIPMNPDATDARRTEPAKPPQGRQSE